MNYIARLKANVEDADAQRTNALAAIDEFRAFLQSAKFTGTDQDGDRKDWIATADVLAWLSNLRSDLA